MTQAFFTIVNVGKKLGPDYECMASTLDFLNKHFLLAESLRVENNQNWYTNAPPPVPVIVPPGDNDLDPGVRATQLDNNGGSLVFVLSRTDSLTFLWRERSRREFLGIDIPARTGLNDFPLLNHNLLIWKVSLFV